MEDGTSSAASAAPAHPGLEQRLEVVCKAVGIPVPRGSGRYAQVIHALRGAIPREQAVYVLFQLFLSRLATQREVEIVVRNFDYDTNDQLRQFFMDSDEFRTGGQADIRFESVPKSTLLTDVSHTLTYPHNTGIQRVVRCMSEQMAKENLDQRLVSFDPKLNNFRLLDSTATALLYDWERPREYSSVNMNERLSPVKDFLKRLAGKQLSEAVRSFTRAWKDVGRERRQRKSKLKTLKETVKSKTSTVLFLWNNRLLIPEVISDVWRLERMTSLLAHTPVSATLVAYDFIPLQHPEFCMSSDGFIHYLTLLRLVDRVSCISQAIETDVRNMLPLIERRGPAPVVETHYLGGDFDFRREEAADAKADELPVALCVGSIEFRKNQIRVLRAMVAAQERGCKFRGVFAGNYGWMSDSFLEELSFFQERGFKVEVRRSIGEAELRQLYAQSAFTLFCSLVEGFGLPIVESVVKGVPCIVSDRGCMKEVAGKLGGCVLVDPESESAIADAIVSLCQNPQRLQQLRAEARNARWHTWRDYARNIYDFAAGTATGNANVRKAA